MKTLIIIQTLSKIGRILSKIVFVCCVVAFSVCAVSLALLPFGFEMIEIGDVTIKGLLNRFGDSEVSISLIYATVSSAMIVCAGEAVVSKFAECYFKRELNDGTPFNLEGAGQLMRLGIISICVSIGAEVLAAIVSDVIFKYGGDTLVADYGDISFGGNISIGIMLIVMSLLCRYGVERELAAHDKNDGENA